MSTKSFVKKSSFGMLFAVATLVASCSSHEDFPEANNNGNTPEEEVGDNGKAQAENALGVTISPSQTWTNVVEKQVTFANIPQTFKGAALAVLTEDPFIDTLGVGTMLAYLENTTGPIEFEAPSNLQTLYAACIRTDGQMLVRPFGINDATVDMSANGMTTVAANKMKTRADEAAALVFNPTLNATLFADKGWENDRFALIDRGDVDVKFTNFTSIADSYKTFIPEGNNNANKMKQFENVYNFHWSVVGEGGGEVTIIPVHKESAEYEYIGYFYCLPGQDINFKDTPKYVFSEGVLSNMKDLPNDYQAKAYRLVYYDEQGNASYTFPEGTKIYFFLHHFPSMKAYAQCDHSWNAHLPIDYYSFPDLNRDMLLHLNQEHGVNFNKYGGNDDWEEQPRVVYFNRNGINYVSMEDGTDMDMNDIVFMVQGAVEDFPESETVETKTQVYTYAFEDNLQGDYDMNDVVLRVWRDGRNFELKVQLVATGAKHDLVVYYDDHGSKYSEPVALFGGKEVHEALGVEAGTFVNTQTNNVKVFPTTNVMYDYKTFRYYKADFYVYNKTTGTEIHLPAAKGIAGGAPYGICIPNEWKWPVERTRITDAYAGFAGYAANPSVNVGWYTEPNNKVFILK